MILTQYDPAFLAVDSGSTPTLDLQLAATSTLDSRITFTRASAATAPGATGSLVSYSNNIPAFAWNPLTLTPLGQQFWESRTNLALWSEDFTNAAWTKVSTTITGNDTLAPDGTNTADLFTVTSTFDSVQGGVTVISGATVACSVFAKRGNHDWIRLTLLNGGNEVRAWFNLATGSVGSQTATGTGVPGGIFIQPAANGFYRCVLVGAITGATSYTFLTASASADASFTRVSGGTRFQWGAQIEQGADASPYISTTTTAIIRAADVASETGLAWLNQTQGTFVVEGIAPSNFSDSPVAVGDASARIMAGFTTGRAAQSWNGSISLATSNTVTAGSAFKIAFSYDSVGRAISMNGGAVATDTNTFGTMTGLNIGRRTTAQYLDSTISRIRFFPKSLRPNLQTLSTL